MEKLEIKLTLTAASTPDLLAYLSGIPSARDRAYILKRLATRGLAGVADAVGLDMVAFPAAVTAATPAASDHPVSPPTLFPASARESGALPLSPAPLPAPVSEVQGQIVPQMDPFPADGTGPAPFNIDALNAAMERFY
ncbi:hypothetical protein CNECB9_3760040 [Cupriavidus necator]|uniref:Uncharacterized protein n=1 Tax=Cupriavidus necator TaxID=106590 RepID=A0A1K0IJ22_CUPNE|nr:hypothetical protein CNECB9_3760040 [Cupriavidus necator]